LLRDIERRYARIVKAIGGGMLGALIIVAAFLAGARWNELTKNPSPPFVRYEMHVGADGTVTRMDRVTGQLHMVTASGAGDVPERFVAPAVTPAKP
jgi:hypothetical protein